MIHNELVLLVCFSTADARHGPPNMKQSNTLQKIQYLNYITGIPVLYKILKTNHNTGTNFYTSIVHNTSKGRSPSNGKLSDFSFYIDS